MRTRLVFLAAIVSMTAACGSIQSPGTRGPKEASTPPTASTPMPTRIPAARGVVTTRGLVTVLDAGEGPVICLGAVATSYPPQCGGPKLVNFSWDHRAGTFEAAAGVRWGQFVVTGTFDGRALTVRRVLPEALYDAAALPGEEPSLATPCPAPDGGWRVLDPARTTDATMAATFDRATKLPGYAGAWMDQTRNPHDGNLADEGMNDPAYVTLNVRVTEDAAGAEAELRKIWGGALCVSLAAHTDQELRQIQDRLTKLPGTLRASSGFDHVDIEVVHDDGSLQAWADAVYGRGLVRITSALVPLG